MPANPLPTTIAEGVWDFLLTFSPYEPGFYKKKRKKKKGTSMRVTKCSNKKLKHYKIIMMCQFLVIILPKYCIEKGAHSA